MFEPFYVRRLQVSVFHVRALVCVRCAAAVCGDVWATMGRVGGASMIPARFLLMLAHFVLAACMFFDRVCLPLHRLSKPSVVTVLENGQRPSAGVVKGLYCISIALIYSRLWTVLLLLGTHRMHLSRHVTEQTRHRTIG